MLTLLLVIGPRIPHPLATVGSVSERWTSRYLHL
jgi:hypothetical protein